MQKQEDTIYKLNNKQVFQIQKSGPAKIQTPQIQLKIDNYCQHLKDLRIKYKPPITDDNLKGQFCSAFDNNLLKRSLKEVTQFIDLFRKRKTSFAGNYNEARHLTPKEQQQQKKRRLSEQYAQKFQHDQEEVDRLLLYTWQLSNIRTIVSSESSSIWAIPPETVNNIHRLCISTSRIHVSRWGIRHVTMQAMQICYFNLIKNCVFEVDPGRNGSLSCLIQAVLADTTADQPHLFVNLQREFGQMTVGAQQDAFTKNENKKQEQEPNNSEFLCPPQKPLRKKSSTQLQLQWFTYIIEHCMCHCDHFLKQTCLQLSNGSIQNATPSSRLFLHYLSTMLDKIVNDRTTTELVRGYPCQIEDVKKMYSRSNSKTVGMEIKISWADYEWILQSLLPEMLRQYKKSLRNKWLLQVRDDNKTNSNYSHAYIYSIMSIIAIINCCNFLGGYNNQLQKRTSKLVMSCGLEFLQLSFLIYELCHAKKRNIELKTQETLRVNYIENLQNLLEINQEKTKAKHQSKEQGKKFSIDLKQVKGQPLKKMSKSYYNVLPLEEGQLVCIIRMLSNLVHINEHAQKMFQDNIKYFRIIMSLTHEIESQLTMKNWAIVFLRNVAERSSIMRDELAKLEIDVKVDNGATPFI